jgi:ABC-2 type transport system permease protein
MRALIHAELLKLRTTRTVYGLLAAMLALVAAGVVATLLDADDAVTSLPVAEQEFLGPILGSVATTFILVLGLRSFTDEFRYGSIVPTLLGTPHRGRVLAAKVVAVSAWSVVFAVSGYALALAIGVPWLKAEGVNAAAQFGPLAALLGKIALVSIWWAGLGVGVGLAARHQVAAIVGSLLWVMIGESILISLLPEVGKYLPSNATSAMIGGPGEELLGPAGGALMLAAWSAAAIGAGAILMRRRDVA